MALGRVLLRLWEGLAPHTPHQRARPLETPVLRQNGTKTSPVKLV
jgi:hypothetical protein